MPQRNPAPHLTREQRMEALCKAAEARSARADIKRRVASGELPFADAIDLPGASRIPVIQLIAAVPGYGRVKSARLMHDLGISGSRRVGGLGCRQREGLLRELS